jgi:predicted lipoprotein with Yx(FWY)xxD motif
MKHSRNLLFFAVGLALALVLAACGSSNGSSSGPYGVGSSGGQTPTATTGSSGSAVVIKTATMTVQGKSITALVNSQGLTLYYRTSDTPSSVCSGGCASAWPPLISSSTPSAASALPGTLSVLTDANGSQVTYNGHPLYTYSGDSAPGQANGEGVGGVWFVAPTNLAASTPGSTPTPGGYYKQGG